MRVLGAVLAGGQSSRFGSDKAEALLHGRPLLAHALEQLRRHVASVVVVGRQTELAPCAVDWPRPGEGPLGGIAGAFHYAESEGYEWVLSVPVDALSLPDDLLSALSPGPACLGEQPVIGLWPVSAAQILDELLAGDGRKSMFAFAEAIGARRVSVSSHPANINTVADLVQLEQRNGI
jgi:molybdopterin-guanine dinucleotide biosynthesis protein A